MAEAAINTEYPANMMNQSSGNNGTTEKMEDQIYISRLEYDIMLRKISFLKNQNDVLCRSLRTIDILAAGPNGRPALVTDQCKVLYDFYQYMFEHLGSPTASSVDTIFLPMLTILSCAESFPDMFLAENASPLSKTRPLPTFVNYQKTFDVNLCKPDNSELKKLLRKFSVSLSDNLSNTHFLHAHHISSTVIHGYIKTMITCIVFHRTGRNSFLFRYKVDSPTSVDYDNQALYDSVVRSPNFRDLAAVPTVVDPASNNPQVSMDLGSQKSKFAEKMAAAAQGKKFQMNIKKRKNF